MRKPLFCITNLKRNGTRTSTYWSSHAFWCILNLKSWRLRSFFLCYEFTPFMWGHFPKCSKVNFYLIWDLHDSFLFCLYISFCQEWSSYESSDMKEEAWPLVFSPSYHSYFPSSSKQSHFQLFLFLLTYLLSLFESLPHTHLLTIKSVWTELWCFDPFVFLFGNQIWSQKGGPLWSLCNVWMEQEYLYWEVAEKMFYSRKEWMWGDWYGWHLSSEPISQSSSNKMWLQRNLSDMSNSFGWQAYISNLACFCSFFVGPLESDSLEWLWNQVTFWSVWVGWQGEFVDLRGFVMS